MKKSLLMMIACITIFSYSPVKAETVTKNDLYLREDLILNFLFPLIDKEIKRQLGEPKQFYCSNILNIRKLEQGSYFFDVTVQVIIFEGAHKPPNDLVTITFSNSNYKPWRAIEFKTKRLKPNEVDKCREPI
ncbi:DUF3888 domain-containing protein [Mesobacillus foraminis]|uniref:DUF3888 domain-containing protein n=1 Tax=Mesobacillus foraminis TaxID=279826 RepID=UPI000EF49441|nr:DUF3888 domain-containing protein [Mesobacillus foraminis]